MNEAFKLPPKSVKLLTKPDELTQNFSELIERNLRLPAKQELTDLILES
jgi:hypothetical protein